MAGGTSRRAQRKELTLIVGVVGMIRLVFEFAIPPRVRDEDDDFARCLDVLDEQALAEGLVAPGLDRLVDAALLLELLEGHGEQRRRQLEGVEHRQRVAAWRDRLGDTTSVAFNFLGLAIRVSLYFTTVRRK